MEVLIMRLNTTSQKLEKHKAIALHLTKVDQNMSACASFDMVCIFNNYLV